jgi:sugar lactone lactonase YvrE
MWKALIGVTAVVVVAVGVIQRVSDRPTPAAITADVQYDLVEAWAGTPEEVGMVSAVDVDADGNVYAFRREANNVWKLDPSGKLLEVWNHDFAQWAHGIRVGPDGAIWTVDGEGHQVKKWSSDGKELLMTLGQLGVAGEGPDTFNRPTDVAFGPGGEIFVSDGYANTRVVKFNSDGRFIKAWGEPGTEPGQFDLPHTVVVDSRNRVLVGDRENARIQIFDLDGNLLEVWDHLGSPYGLYLTSDDLLYVADLVNARIWIANAEDGKHLGTIEGTEAIHWVAVGPEGDVYAATPATARYYDDPADVWYLRKYRKVIGP